MSAAVTGYLHPDYARSVAPDERTVALPRCGGWLVERSSPDGRHADLSWPYPIFSCRDWRALEGDLDALDRRFVTVTILTDPFGEYDETTLSRCFPDMCRRYKDHFVVDLRSSPSEPANSNHRRNARRALADLEIERAMDPARLLDDWVALYRCLVERHGITGVQRFSRSAFAIQLTVPGIVAFTARLDGEIAGMILFYVQGDRVYYHLGAYSDAGYEHRASFGLFHEAINALRDDGLAWLSLGAGAGSDPEGSDGLTRFKRGWSTGTRSTWIGGRVLDAEAYRLLESTAPAEAPPDYFPRYRFGEYG
jgi:hypothetical protein